MEHGTIKLGMVIMMQPDLAKAVDFYQTLGLTLNFHLPNRWAEFDLGCVKIGLCPTEQAQDNVRTGVVFEIAQDLLAFHAAMKEKNITFVNEPVIAPHGVMVGVKDPGGNVFDLYQPTPEKMKEFVEQSKEEKKNE